MVWITLSLGALSSAALTKENTAVLKSKSSMSRLEIRSNARQSFQQAPKTMKRYRSFEEFAKRLDEISIFVGNQLHLYIQQFQEFLERIGIQIAGHLRMLAGVIAKLFKSIGRLILFFMPGVVLILVGLLFLDIVTSIGIFLILIGITFLFVIVFLIFHYGRNADTEDNKIVDTNSQEARGAEEYDASSVKNEKIEV